MWKIITYVISVGGVIVGAFAAVEFFMTRALCDHEIKEEIASPLSDLKLVVFEYNCGPGSEPNTQVSVLPANKSFSPEKYPAFFHINGNQKLRIKWEEEQIVSIKKPIGSVVNKELQPSSVKVIYIN
jgi:hypothetical protein